MNELTITYIIGTDNIDGLDIESCAMDALKAEIEEKIREAFKDAKFVDVVVDNGSSKVRVEGLDNDEYGEKADSIAERVSFIASEVWDRGEWHNA